MNIEYENNYSISRNIRVNILRFSPFTSIIQGLKFEYVLV